MKEVHTVIKFNQEVWLKPYIDMKTANEKNKKWFWKRFSRSWLITQLLEKPWKIRENKDISNLPRIYQISTVKYIAVPTEHNKW